MNFLNKSLIFFLLFCFALSEIWDSSDIYRWDQFDTGPTGGIVTSTEVSNGDAEVRSVSFWNQDVPAVLVFTRKKLFHVTMGGRMRYILLGNVDQLGIQEWPLKGSSATCTRNICSGFHSSFQLSQAFYYNGYLDPTHLWVLEETTINDPNAFYYGNTTMGIPTLRWRSIDLVTPLVRHNFASALTPTKFLVFGGSVLPDTLQFDLDDGEVTSTNQDDFIATSPPSSVATIGEIAYLFGLNFYGQVLIYNTTDMTSTKVSYGGDSIASNPLVGRVTFSDEENNRFFYIGNSDLLSFNVTDYTWTNYGAFGQNVDTQKENSISLINYNQTGLFIENKMQFAFFNTYSLYVSFVSLCSSSPPLFNESSLDNSPYLYSLDHCYYCPPGSFEWNGRCYPCYLGWGNQYYGSIACENCENNYIHQTNNWTPYIAYTTFNPFKNWLDANGVSTQCYDNPSFFCDLGYFVEDNDDECSLCPAGKYRNDVDWQYCHPCPPGYYSQENMYSPNVNCNPCYNGTFTSEYGMTGCTYCPQGASSFQASKSVHDCFCPGDLYPLTVTTWGTFREQLCMPCPEHATCFNTSVYPDPGYWVDSESIAALIECPRAASCPGGGSNKCSVGYTGRACTTCDEGYFFINDSCLHCPASNSFLLVILGFVIAILCVILYRTGVKRHYTSLLLCLNFIQISTLLPRLKIEWPPELVEFFRAFSFANLDIGATSPECMFVFTYFEKILIMFITPIFFLVLLSLPYFVGLILSRDKIQEIKEKCFGGFIRFLRIIYMYVSLKSIGYFNCVPYDYPGLFDDTVLLLPYEQWQTYSLFKKETSYMLIEDANIHCYTGDWSTYEVIPILSIIFYVVGIPLTFLYFLYKYKKNGEIDEFYEHRDNDNVEDFTSSLKTRFGFLIQSYKSKSYYWEIFIMTELFLLSVFQTINQLSSSSAVIGCGILLLISLVIHIIVRPYQHAYENYGSIFLKGINAIMTLSGLAFVGGTTAGMGIFLIVCIIVGLLIAMLLLSKELYQYFLQRKNEKESITLR